ncbi:MAG: hypothetical protein GC129_06505 [Proteobacteria bacterium]|nr:hypothetical protein [Pseudomonadota bacterium]
MSANHVLVYSSGHAFMDKALMAALEQDKRFTSVLFETADAMGAHACQCMRQHQRVITISPQFNAEAKSLRYCVRKDTETTAFTASHTVYEPLTEDKFTGLVKDITSILNHELMISGIFHKTA